MKCFGVSDIGLIRKVNQDCFTITYNERGDLLCIVCDGIGGGKAGDIAAKMACTYLEKAFNTNPDLGDDVKVSKWISSEVSKCNTFINQQAKNNLAYSGMGTTLVGFVRVKEHTYIFHVGDSRVYAMYDHLVLLTKDHNLRQDLISAKELSMEEIEVHPHRNMLTNALGIWEQIKVDIRKIKEGYQMILVCSDGLHGLVEDSQIEKILQSDNDLQGKANLLIESAKYYGGFDNITVILGQN